MIAAATALTFFALTGFESATTPVGKVREPVAHHPARAARRTRRSSSCSICCRAPRSRCSSGRRRRSSPAPFADALVARLGRRRRDLRRAGDRDRAFGCLNGLILRHRRARLCHGAARRPAGGHGQDPRHANTPVVPRSSGLSVGITILLMLANSSRATAGLFTFVILLVDRGRARPLPRRRTRGVEAEPGRSARARSSRRHPVRRLRTYGIGLEAGLWCLVLLAVGLCASAWSCTASIRAAASPAAAAAPAAPPESSA